MLRKLFRPRMEEGRGSVENFIMKSFTICTFQKNVARIIKSLIILLARYAARIE